MVYIGKLKKLPKITVSEYDSVLGGDWELKRCEDNTFDVVFNAKSEKDAKAKLFLLKNIENIKEN